jgi:hypothetical protein
MDEPEEKREKIDKREAGGVFYLIPPLQQIVDGGDDDGNGDEKFCPAGGQVYRACGCKGQRNGMADGKGGYQHNHFSPVPKLVAETERAHEEDMIHGLQRKDMMYANAEIYIEFSHVCRNFVSRWSKLFRLLYHKNFLFEWLHPYLNG